jgi:hypothetical protein
LLTTAESKSLKRANFFEPLMKELKKTEESVAKLGKGLELEAGVRI